MFSAAPFIESPKPDSYRRIHLTLCLNKIQTSTTLKDIDKTFIHNERHESRRLTNDAGDFFTGQWLKHGWPIEDWISRYHKKL